MFACHVFTRDFCLRYADAYICQMPPRYDAAVTTSRQGTLRAADIYSSIRRRLLLPRHYAALIVATRRSGMAILLRHDAMPDAAAVSYATILRHDATSHSPLDDMMLRRCFFFALCRA